ncbi:hypothetical protein V8G54_010547 [Vigna mungo]|uniref:Integrase catalytic domain-containing protein n=1 Tax=Vigna mungo TaxID=3915 RepID=A0AAQ3NWR9_VIGMU
MAWSETQPMFLQELKHDIATDEYWKQQLQDCELGNNQNPHISSKDQLLFWKGRLVIPQQSPLISKILEAYHCSPIGGHSGIARTISRVKAEFYWPKMKEQIHKFVQHCSICQQAKYAAVQPAGLLQPLPIPSQIWEDISMDFITGLPVSKGFTVILVIVDRLSKYAHFQPLKADYTSTQVADLFCNTVVGLHGMPKSIVSDRDKTFTSKFWQQLFKLQGTTLAMSTAYHPQSDGQTEAVNKALELYLRCFTSQSPKNWVNFLPWAEYWYNTSFHHSIGMTPFKVVYGRDPPGLLRYQPSPSDNPSVKDSLLARDALLNKLKENLFRAQQYMKHQADKKRIEKHFQIGDKVWVKLKPYRQHSVQLRQNQKLSMRYFGPFTILAKIGSVAYKLLLPVNAKIHPIFHVSQLKEFKGDDTATTIPLPLLIDEEGIMLQPLQVLNRRTILKGEQLIPQVLVQWSGQEVSEATWENAEDMSHLYPNFNLEVKVIFNGGSIVMDPEENIPLQAENDELVIEEGHVAAFPENALLRRSICTKRTNTRLRDFVQGK